MPTLSCIGAGLLGKPLCHLLSNQLDIQQVVNRSMASSQQAVDFIGAGRAADSACWGAFGLFHRPDYSLWAHPVIHYDFGGADRFPWTCADI